jgi:predicted ATP-binding protein involved in virulence
MITTFKITDQKVIRLAECVSVPRIMIIYGQNGVGKSTLLYAVKQDILKNVVRNEDVIFISPSAESQQKQNTGTHVHIDDLSSRITPVLGRLEIARRNIIAASSFLDNKNIAEYTSISHVYKPLNKLLNYVVTSSKI